MAKRVHRSVAAFAVALVAILLAVSFTAYSKLSSSVFVRSPGLGAQIIKGQASVIDGDSLEIHGIPIRLFGIDAPESGQTCTAQGKVYRCGQQAANAFADKIRGHTVECRQRDTDRYGRIVAVCTADGDDLNGWMVSEGWALAYRQYSNDYIDHERKATNSKRGIWRGNFEQPWEWRQTHAQSTINVPSGPAKFVEPPTSSGEFLRSKSSQPNAATPTDCVIKGNISSRGRVYHLPGDEYYDRTGINVAKGERWFCSEAEAQAAGWRRARR